jgi:hypothetical protein
VSEAASHKSKRRSVNVVDPTRTRLASHICPENEEEAEKRSRMAENIEPLLSKNCSDSNGFAQQSLGEQFNVLSSMSDVLWKEKRFSKWQHNKISIQNDSGGYELLNRLARTAL